MYKEFAKIFGLKLDEEFSLYYTLSNGKRVYKDSVFKITEKGMFRKDCAGKSFYFTDIYLHVMLLGTYSVERRGKYVETQER